MRHSEQRQQTWLQTFLQTEQIRPQHLETLDSGIVTVNTEIAEKSESIILSLKICVPN